MRQLACFFGCVTLKYFLPGSLNSLNVLLMSGKCKIVGQSGSVLSSNT